MNKAPCFAGVFLQREADTPAIFATTLQVKQTDYFIATKLQ